MQVVWCKKFALVCYIFTSGQFFQIFENSVRMCPVKLKIVMVYHINNTSKKTFFWDICRCVSNRAKYSIKWYFSVFTIRLPVETQKSFSYSLLKITELIFHNQRIWTRVLSPSYTLKYILLVSENLLQIWAKVAINNLFPVHPFSNPWKHRKTLLFSDFFRGSRKDALGTNVLIGVLVVQYLRKKSGS